MSMGLFGGTEQVSTQTEEQERLLKGLGGLQDQYNAGAYSGLNALATGKSSYQAVPNWQTQFQNGVVNPALQQLNQQIGNTKHSSMLHSSANRYAQDQLRQNTINNLSGLRYDDVMKQQGLQLNAEEANKQRQFSALQALLGGNQTVLGTQAVGLQNTGGLLDLLSAGGSLATGIGAIK